MAIKKKVTKTPAVRVETRKLPQHDTCTTSSCYKMKGLLILILFLINTLLIGFVAVRQGNIAAEQFGWRQNYKIVQQIFKTDMFKQQQAQQLQETLNVFKAGVQPQAAQQQGAPMLMPEDIVME